MNFENISTPEKEKEIPRITAEEWIKYSGSKPEDDKEFEAWMKDKGIEFDEDGIAEIDLDGEVVRTSKDDFGTIKQEPDAIIEKASA